jgi:hypothetical protein
LRQALLSTCEQAMTAASPDRRARRIKAAGVEARSPFDQGLRESPSLMSEIRAKTRRAGAFGAAVNHQQRHGRGAWASAARPPTEGRADNFSLDINSVTAA